MSIQELNRKNERLSEVLNIWMGLDDLHWHYDEYEEEFDKVLEGLEQIVEVESMRLRREYRKHLKDNRK